MNNQSIKIAEQKLIEARGKKEEAFSGFLPQLEAGFSYTKLNETPKMEIPAGVLGTDAVLAELGTDELYNAKLTLTQPLFTWGKISRTYKQARLSYLLAEEEYRKTKNNLIFDVTKSFFGVLLTQQFVNINQEAHFVMSNHLEVTRALYNEGKVSDYDVSRVKVQVINAKTNFIKAKNKLNLALELLWNLLNVTIDDNVIIKSQLEYEKEQKNMDNCLKEALLRRPEIKQMNIHQDMTESLLKITKARNKPTIALVGNYDWQHDKWSTSTSDWDKTWDATLALTIPIFDGLSTRGRVKQSRARLVQVSLQKEQLIEAVKLEVKKAFFDFEESKERIEAQTENVELARSNLKTAQARYKLGLMSDLEVRDAQFALTQAETNYFQALYDYNVARAALHRAMGE